MFQGFLLPRGPRDAPERRAGGAGRHPSRAPDAAPRYTVRLAEPQDFAHLERIAALDCAHVPQGTLLVGEVGGAIQAALPVAGGRAIANPFVRTLELVHMLELRAEQLRAAGLHSDARIIPLPSRATLPRPAA
jgi:hypothetical protein